MTDIEWNACTDLQSMLKFLQGQASDRKMGLFAVAVGYLRGKTTYICTWNDRKKQLFWLAVACWPESLLLTDEKNKLAGLLHHIAGNPFQPHPALNNWTTPVLQLADALYNGQDCGFALHDALLEAGHPELAEHFRQEQWHPKGCWLLDLILGKN